MKKLAKLSLYVLIAIIVLASIGCGKKGGSVDTSKSITEIKAEAEKMDLSQLKAMAEKYKNAILDKTKELDKLKDKMPSNPLSDEAAKIVQELDDLSNSINTLKDHFQVYYDQLKAKGGDVSGLEL